MASGCPGQPSRAALGAGRRRIVPALADSGTSAFLRGTGLTTNVVYVQDLALWLPLMAVAAAGLWRRRPWGYLIAGAGLVMWVIESVSIAR